MFDWIGSAWNGAGGFTWLLELQLKATAVLAGVGLILCVRRRPSAALRHALWAAGIMVALLLPVASTLLPQYEVPLLPAGAEAYTANIQRAATAGHESNAATPAGIAASFGGPLVSSNSAVHGPADLAPPQTVGAEWLVVMWAAGAAAVLAWLVLGLLACRRMCRRSRPVDEPGLLALLRQLAQRAGISRPVRLLWADHAAVPLTCGTRRPAVLLPPAAAGWPAERCRAVLLHELAHIRRHDCLTQLAALVACAFNWMNPCLWAAAACMRRSREQACDDFVIRMGTRASDYAGHLLAIAREQHARRTGPLAAAITRGNELHGRLRRILDGRPPFRGDMNMLAKTSIVVTAAIVLAGSAMIQPWIHPASACDTTVAGKAPHARDLALERDAIARVQAAIEASRAATRELREHETAVEAMDEELIRAAYERLERAARTMRAPATAAEAILRERQRALEAEVADRVRLEAQARKERIEASREAIGAAMKALELDAQRKRERETEQAATGLARAAELQQQLLEIYQDVWGPLDPRTLSAAADLGELLFELGRVQQAQELITRTLEQARQVLPAGDPLVGELEASQARTRAGLLR